MSSNEARTRTSLQPLDQKRSERLALLAAPYFESEVPDQEGSEPASLDLVCSRLDRDLAAQAVLAQEREQPLSTELEPLVAAFGTLMVRELGLEWAASPAVGGEGVIEPVVAIAGTDIVFYPQRLIHRQIEQIAPMSSREMILSARGYLASLRRFFPASI